MFQAVQLCFLLVPLLGNPAVAGVFHGVRENGAGSSRNLYVRPNKTTSYAVNVLFFGLVNKILFVSRFAKKNLLQNFVHKDSLHLG